MVAAALEFSLTGTTSAPVAQKLEVTQRTGWPVGASRSQDAVVEGLGAPVLSFEQFNQNRPSGRIVATSGGFDPIDPGHISSLQESRRHGDVVVAIVNGDSFLRAKKGKPVQDIETRCAIVSAIKGVDYVVPFEVDGDMAVRQALRLLHPDVFTKGGDRVDPASIPKWDVCQELGIEVMSGVGDATQWSSSWFLEDCSKHVIQQHDKS